MTNNGIYAINASILSTGPFWLVDIVPDKELTILSHLFNIITEGEEEWHIKINQENVEASNHPIAIQIKKSITELGDFLSKNASDDENEQQIRDELWNLTWVW